MLFSSSSAAFSSVIPRKMRTLVVVTFFVSSLEFVFCTHVYPAGRSEDILTQLSREGERHVDEEMKRALFGVKQMKEMMEKSEEKHKQLMSSLKHSSDKRKGAVQLATEAEQKLQEAEQQCRDSLRMSFEECRPCLEDTCKGFYTSTCRRGFSSFSFKVEEFFRKMSSQLETPDQVYNQNQDNMDQIQKPETQKAEGPDQELMQVEASFRQLRSRVGLLYNRSMELVNRMHQEFGQTFRVAFTTELKPRSLSPTQEAPSLGFLGGMGLEHILDSVYDFGRTVLEEFNYAMADGSDEVKEAQQQQRDAGTSSLVGQPHSRYLCRQLRRQASDCWLLQSQCENCQDALIRECPSVRDLHSELEEISLLLNVSRQQYDDMLLVVRKHTDDTHKWLDITADKYGWVTRLANNTLGNIFSVTAVAPHMQMRDSGTNLDTTVTVKILDSSLFTLSVPDELELQDPAFIQYVAKEALEMYKQRVKQIP